MSTCLRAQPFSSFCSHSLPWLSLAVILCGPNLIHSVLFVENSSSWPCSPAPASPPFQYNWNPEKLWWQRIFVCIRGCPSIIDLYTSLLSSLSYSDCSDSWDLCCCQFAVTHPFLETKRGVREISEREISSTFVNFEYHQQFNPH